MAKRPKSWSRIFFGTTRDVYRAQRAARTVRAVASGKPGRVVKLYERRLLYRLFARLVNRVVR